MTAKTGKTLTVTYGAFACTIEGYDDPMPVLRSVVAYFRDLVAEDQAFGRVAPDQGDTPVITVNASPLSPEEIASLATPEPGESRVTATVSTEAARATFIRRDPLAPPLNVTPLNVSPLNVTPASEPMLERLMETAEAALQSPDAQRRAATIANLKAAMAEAPQGEPITPADDVDRYRDDLIVLSRTGTHGIEPLVLTPDLRVDRRPIDLMPHEAVQEEGRPLRPAPLRLSDFVQRTGAASVAERMEAAAAHAIVLEGRDSLSRPALLRAMEMLEPEPIGFEESLRVFGTLLRDGRLRKADYGRYTIGEESRFVAEARALLA